MTGWSLCNNMQDADGDGAEENLQEGEHSGEYFARSSLSDASQSDFEERRRVSETEELTALKGQLIVGGMGIPSSHNRKTNTNTNLNSRYVSPASHNRYGRTSNNNPMEPN